MSDGSSSSKLIFSTQHIKCDEVVNYDDLCRVIRRKCDSSLYVEIPSRQTKCINYDNVIFNPTIQCCLIRGSHELVTFNMAGQQQCVECKTSTKYKCINCKVCVCNRRSCSVAEVDEETVGWLENISVAYCNSCFLGYNKLMPLDRLEGGNEEEDDEVANILSSKNNKNGMKTSGRRSL